MTPASLALSLSLLLAGCAAAPPPADRSRPAADEAAIRAVEERERAAVLDRDVAALGQLWSEHLVVNTPANRISPDRSAVFDLLRRGAIHYSSFERSIERVRIDGDLAIVMGAETIRPAADAPRAGQTVQRRFTHVWRKEGEGWLLIARHSNVIAAP